MLKIKRQVEESLKFLVCDFFFFEIVLDKIVLEDLICVTAVQDSNQSVNNLVGIYSHWQLI